MADKRPAAFLLFSDAALGLSFLPDEVAGRVIKAAARYFLRRGEKPSMEDEAGDVLQLLCYRVDTSYAQYADSQENGRKGAAKRYKKECSDNDKKRSDDGNPALNIRYSNE